MISSSTGFLGLFGWPIAHSLSPTMQNAALRAWGKDAVYGAFSVPLPKLDAAMSGAKEMGFLGLNITLPFKEFTLSLCQPDLLATRVGAVNTICFQTKQVRGTNTDIEGFKQLCAETGVTLDGAKQAVILGAGGAAKAVIVALHDQGTPYRIFSRKANPIHVDGQKISCLPLKKEALAPSLSSCDLLVDCTPRGLLTQKMGSSTEQAFLTHYPELDLSLLPQQATVLDLAVRSSTLLTDMAKFHGLRASCGHIMLVHQGAKALEYWFSEPLPKFVVDVMRTAIASPLGVIPRSA